MKIEVRNDSVIISGYVNAIERYSKPITENLYGKIRTFIERIKAGVFKNALKRNDDVKVLLNHDNSRVLATTKDGSAKLEEDNIGLRAEVTITDKEVVEKARNNQLVGWSFGFIPNADELGVEGENESRTITDLDLLEVSILDDTKSPAYYGTSIEARAEKEVVYRNFEEIGELEEDARKKHNEIYEESEKQHLQVESEVQKAKLQAIAEMVADIIIAKMNSSTIPEEKAEDEVTENETTKDTEDTAEETSKDEEKEKRAIDYSEYEKRLANLK